MTPLQKFISKIEDVMFSNEEANDQLLMIRAMAEILLAEERQFIEHTYYQGRRDQVFRENDLMDYMDKVNAEPW